MTESKLWHALKDHQKSISSQRMQDWFAEDAERFNAFSLQLEDILFDYSKNLLTEETLKLLCEFAKESNLSEKINALFNGETVNVTESRPALHSALRNNADPIYINNINISSDIADTLNKMREFSDKIRNHTWLGCTGKPITTIVNVGIGGSHLGPFLTTHALNDFAEKSLKCYFISNIDSTHVNSVLTNIDPETTLFIISSKSFTTIETMTNATTVKKWLQTALGNKDLTQHFVAVTAKSQKAIEFGIPEAQIFPLWDWVGGRYSIWSSVGLPLVIMIGMDQFLEFLAGGQAADKHFRETDFSKNIPILMALIGIWYINFFNANNLAILPYAHQLNYLPTYLQQADMESNGKQTSFSGTSVSYATSPIIWGEQGCNAQHAFFQSLHQGLHFTPIDFILSGHQKNNFASHQNILIGSGLSQAQALMQGKSYDQVLNELLCSGLSEDEAKRIAPHKIISGNHPSNVLFLKDITPYNLGMLIALYEHKIFAQGALWDINSFDQWGVELGKELLPRILDKLKQPDESIKLDSSTQGLIDYYNTIGKFE